ncbi:flavin reductase [Burkholderia glumae]|uniref:flavin reductase n=1 Tax=Burkholderia glumae TaxID=337 RepID=UPI0014641A17|nr:flavin reductase [Burkholderia glumae]QJP69450.1 4-hydroxyphenylacetate 3-monooxygenase [Burkholderia glumae]UVS99426.1 4-hydroxyphenylacetate 3-monooxygenase [Burkholderia glumae]
MIHNEPARFPDSPLAASPQQFRDAMCRVASAVHVLTSDGPAGRCGMTATAVLSVSDAPPTVLVSVNRGSVSAQRLIANEVFCVNTLGAADRSIAEVFAGRTAHERDARFTAGEWRELATRAPVLSSARVALDCRLVATLSAATHELLVGEVVALRCAAPDDEALVYLQREFRAV